jgi:hypothetical protein
MSASGVQIPTHKEIRNYPDYFFLFRSITVPRFLKTEMLELPIDEYKIWEIDGQISRFLYMAEKANEKRNELMKTEDTDAYRKAHEETIRFVRLAYSFEVLRREKIADEDKRTLTVVFSRKRLNELSDRYKTAIACYDIFYKNYGTDIEIYERKFIFNSIEDIRKIETNVNN